MLLSGSGTPVPMEPWISHVTHPSSELRFIVPGFVCEAALPLCAVGRIVWQSVEDACAPTKLPRWTPYWFAPSRYSLDVRS